MSRSICVLFNILQIFPFMTNYFQCRGELGKTTIYKWFTHQKNQTVTNIQVQEYVILFLTHRHWYWFGDFAGEPCNCCQKISPHLQVGRGRTLLLQLLFHFTADWPFRYGKSARVSDLASECVAGNCFNWGKSGGEAVRSASSTARTCCQWKQV